MPTTVSLVTPSPIVLPSGSCPATAGGERLADDRHPHGLWTIRRREVSAAQHGDAECLQVAIADDVEPDVEVVGRILPNALAVEADRNGPGAAAQHGDACAPSRRHAGRRPQPLEDLPVNHAAGLLAVAPHIQIDIRHHRRIEQVAEVDRVGVAKRAQEQPAPTSSIRLTAT
jgi:hypothetical protein